MLVAHVNVDVHWVRIPSTIRMLVVHGIVKGEYLAWG